MPQIPEVPTLQPVPQPLMSPSEAARPGETVERLGQEGEQIGQVGTELTKRLIGAQRQVSVKQGQIALEHYQNQVYDDLRKATTPEEVDSVYENYQKQWPTIIAPLEKDHIVARALTVYGQQQAVTMEDTVNARKASIITANDKAANEVLARKYGDEAVTAIMGGGNPATAEGEYHLALQSSVVHGTMTQEQADKDYDQWLLSVKKEAIGGQMNSPNPETRRQLIEQLKTGKGPLDLSGLDQGFLNESLSAAEKRNRELENLAASQNENVVLDKMANAFTQTLYKGNPEMQEAAIRDGEFLKSIGAVTSEGIPDRVMAERVLRPFINAAASDQARVALEKANKDRDEVFDLFAKGQITQGLAKAREYLPDFEKAKTDHYPTIVNAARTWSMWERTQAREGRTEARQAWQDRSDQAASQIYGQIADGKILDLNKDIWSLAIGKDAQLTPRDARELEMMYKQSGQDKDYQAALSYLANLPIASAKTPESNKELVEMVREFKDAAKNLQPGQFMQKVEEIGELHSASKTWQWIQNLFKPSVPRTPVTPSPPSGPPKGATMKVPGSDGKLHWSDGKQDLGVVQ